MSTPDRPLSKDLKPGMRLRFPENKLAYTLARRKAAGDESMTPFQPGWWLVDGGGFADEVLDDPKRVWWIDPPSEVLRAAIVKHHERIKTLGVNNTRDVPQWGGPWDHELWATVGLPSGPDERAEQTGGEVNG